jgi:hypothetical protein
MTAEKYRRLALALPEAAEGSHMSNVDFRVRGKIFATLYPPRLNRGALRLMIEQQKSLMAAEPVCFEPAVGAWGRKGWTLVHLQRANSATVRRALEMAWYNVAPKRLAAQSTKVNRKFSLEEVASQTDSLTAD